MPHPKICVFYENCVIHTNQSLKVTYNYHQWLLKSIKNRDKEKTVSIITNPL